jgi:hypothetical protein
MDVKDEELRLRYQTEYFTNVQKSEDWGLNWADRLDLFTIAYSYYENFTARTIPALYQEYFHQVIPDSDRKYRPEFFQPVGRYRVFHAYGYNWIEWEKYSIPQRIYIQLGLDIGGRKKTNDETVITISCKLPDHRIIVLKQVIGNFTRRDITYEDTSVDVRLHRVIMETDLLKRIGYIDELFRQAHLINADFVKIGYAGGEVETVEEIRLLFVKNGFYKPVTGRLQTNEEGAKHNRIMDNTLSAYESLMVWHTANLEKLESQLKNLTKAKMDDAADSMEVSLNDLPAPSAVSYEEIAGDIDSRNTERKPFFMTFLQKQGVMN